MLDNTKKVYESIAENIRNGRGRSAWVRGVKEYAIELLDELFERIDDGYFDIEDLAAPRILEKSLLNGAGSWSDYSWGGCAFIYDSDIAQRLCTPSELRITRNGDRRPNSREEWLDTQARALFQASNRVKSAVAEYLKNA